MIQRMKSEWACRWESEPSCLSPARVTSLPAWLQPLAPRGQRGMCSAHSSGSTGQLTFNAPRPHPRQARQAWLGPLWHPACAEMQLAELSLQVGLQCGV